MLYWSDSSPPAPGGGGRHPARAVLRALAGWRLAATYGVIPPLTGDRKTVAVFDVAWRDRGGDARAAADPADATDGLAWIALSCRHQTDDSDGGASPAPWCVAPYFPRGEFSMWYSQFVAITRRENLLPPLAQAHARSSASFDESVAHALLRRDGDADARRRRERQRGARARDPT